MYGRLARSTPSSASRPGFGVVGHGPGFGVALVDARSDPLVLAAARLSWDVIAFDQRGCLSPRIALVHGSVSDAEAFADRLARELEERERQVPRGTLTDDERRDQALYRRTVSAVGRCHAGATFTVGVDPVPRALTLPPSGRHVHVARVGEIIDVARLLAPSKTPSRALSGYDSKRRWRTRSSPPCAACDCYPSAGCSLRRSTDRSTFAACYKGSAKG
jgi:hypothetical protein